MIKKPVKITKRKVKATPKLSGHKKRIVTVSIWTVVILFILNLATGIISYGAMAIWCLHPPVIANRFAASYTYFAPGQSGYSPHAFASYYCSEQDAQNAGFNRSNW